MIDFLIGSLITLVSLWVGYKLGKGSSIIPEETQRQVKRLVQALPIKNDLGGVMRPTQTELNKFENPLLEEEEEEIGKTFKEIIK
jgi:hypothetical protein